LLAKGPGNGDRLRLGTPVDVPLAPRQPTFAPCELTDIQTLDHRVGGPSAPKNLASHELSLYGIADGQRSAAHEAHV
jgi:hypothetical protein